MKRLFLFFFALILTGCWQEQAKEEIKTVEWYSNNPTARAEKIKECSNNPGQLEKTPNCKNAQSAKMLSMSQKPASNW